MWVPQTIFGGDLSTWRVSKEEKTLSPALSVTSQMLESVESVDQGTRRAVLSLYRNTRNMEEAARQLTAALRPLDLPALIIWALTIRTSRSHLRSASARYSHTLR
jgi:hypothetical protein